ncbi:MAG: CBS domain-containing protein [Alphaproteobacteria bacterium]|nr:CBS domain-containing protein [Alphaproteobacteria bacterium]
MQIKKIMTTEVQYIEPSTTLKEAARLMKEKDIGMLLVGENKRLTGVITDRDVTIRAVSKGKDPNTTTVKEAMSPQCLYCFEEETVEDVATNMSKNQIRRLPVLNKSKDLVGIVSLGDLSSRGAEMAAAHALHSITEHTRH